MILGLLFAGIENSCRVMKNLTAEARVKKSKLRFAAPGACWEKVFLFLIPTIFGMKVLIPFITRVVIHILIYLLAGTGEQFTLNNTIRLS